MRQFRGCGGGSDSYVTGNVDATSAPLPFCVVDMERDVAVDQPSAALSSAEYEAVHKRNIATAHRLEQELAWLKWQAELDPACDDAHPLSKQCDSILTKSLQRVLATRKVAGTSSGSRQVNTQGGTQQKASSAQVTSCPPVVTVQFEGHACRLASFKRVLAAYPQQKTSTAFDWGSTARVPSGAMQPPVKTLRELRDEACRFWGLGTPDKYFMVVCNNDSRSSDAESHSTFHPPPTATSSLWPLHVSLIDVAAQHCPHDGADPHNSTGALQLMLQKGAELRLQGSTKEGLSLESGAPVELTQAHGPDGDQQAAQRRAEALDFLAYALQRKRRRMLTYGLLMTVLVVVTVSLQVSIYKDYDPAIIVAQACVAQSVLVVCQC